jgi:hypothetical protein
VRGGLLELEVVGVALMRVVAVAVAGVMLVRVWYGFRAPLDHTVDTCESTHAFS